MTRGGVFAQLKTFIDPVSNLEMPYVPRGRFIHVPPSDPVSTWRTDFGQPWWKVRGQRRLKALHACDTHVQLLPQRREHTVCSCTTRVHTWLAGVCRACLPAQNEDFVIGQLSKTTRKIRVVNTLTTQDDLLEVCSEETLLEIQDRYTDYNKHAGSYTWKVRRLPSPSLHRSCSQLAGH